jgi:exodeoxyribonuclease III
MIHAGPAAVFEMRIITLNANGIRAAARKGFFEWLPGQNADVVCLQETRAHPHQILDDRFRPAGYHCYYLDAMRKGYSGVALYSRRRPERVIRGFGSAGFDAEARYVEAVFPGLSISSLYMPSGSSSELRQEAKFRFLDEFKDFLRRVRRRPRQYIICGDWNIAHKEIDLKNWRANQKCSGFLPEERAWMDELFGAWRFVDAFRVVDPRPDRYTWWSSRGRARQNNVGWRIDYQVVTPGLADRIRSAEICTDQCFSDHAPLILDYDWPT